jgi:c(7)-type cytochrome triheme protein
VSSYRAPSRSRLSRWLLLATLPATALFATSIFAVSGAPQEVRIPQVKERSLPAPVLFSHWRHNTQHCYSCHPTLFPQSRLGFTHQEMQAGLYCGACHDGQTAKAVSTMSCEVCHAAR